MLGEEKVINGYPICTVLQIKKSHLSQIRVLCALTTTHLMWEKQNAIWDDLNAKKIHPIGWIMGKHIKGAPSTVEFWLVSIVDDGLYFVPAPERGHEKWKQHQPVPQLFV